MTDLSTFTEAVRPADSAPMYTVDTGLLKRRTQFQDVGHLGWGAIVTVDASASQALATTYTKCTLLGTAHSLTALNATPDHITNHNIALDRGINWTCGFSVTFETDAQGTVDWMLHLGGNPTQIAGAAYANGVVGQVVCVAAQLPINIVATGTVIDLRFKSSAVGNVIVRHGQLWAERTD